MRRTRHLARCALEDLRYAGRLRALPPRVALVQLRSRLLARRVGDDFSLSSATRPRDLARLLALAQGRRHVVELGTATGWTAIALALADSRRRVVTFDTFRQPLCDRYLALAGRQARARIELVTAPGASGPRSPEPVELLYIDSSHTRDDTIDEVRAWAPALGPGALIVLDDYGHSAYPGVEEAVRELGLSGERQGTLFVHRCP